MPLDSDRREIEHEYPQIRGITRRLSRGIERIRGLPADQARARNPMDGANRSWARGLTSAARQHGVTMWPVHFANDAELRAFAPDDLVLED